MDSLSNSSLEDSGIWKKRVMEEFPVNCKKTPSFSREVLAWSEPFSHSLDSFRKVVWGIIEFGGFLPKPSSGSRLISSEDWDGGFLSVPLGWDGGLVSSVQISFARDSTSRVLLPNALGWRKEEDWVSVFVSAAEDLYWESHLSTIGLCNEESCCTHRKTQMYFSSS